MSDPVELRLLLKSLEESRGETARLRTENERLRRRMELDTVTDGYGRTVPAPEGIADGIACRDETIRLLDQAVARKNERLEYLDELLRECRAVLGRLALSDGQDPTPLSVVKRLGQRVSDALDPGMPVPERTQAEGPRP